MYNDFVLIGPKDDPAAVKGKDITGALQKLAAANGASFRAATRAAPTPPNCASGRPPAWPTTRAAGYKECGCGMGPALNMAHRAAPTCWPTAAPGSTSRTAPTWRCWSKATSACSTSTA
jgi:ABC-type tungstate transport system permease subunit